MSPKSSRSSKGRPPRPSNAAPVAEPHGFPVPMHLAIETLVSLGYLTQAHALHGDVRIHLHNDESEIFDNIDHVYIRLGHETQVRRFDVGRWHHDNKGWMLRLKGYEKRHIAEALKRSELYVKPEQMPALDEDEIYHYQVEGMQAIDPEGKPLGTISHVQTNPGHDLLVLQTDVGDEILVPWVPAFVQDIDETEGRITLLPLPGLFPIEEEGASEATDEDKPS